MTRNRSSQNMTEAEFALLKKKNNVRIAQESKPKIFRVISPTKEFIPITGNEKKLSETQIQITICTWAMHHDNLILMPKLELLYHTPNGGKRSGREAAEFQAMGVRSGVPDLILPVARKPFFGLWIELKTYKAFREKNYSLSTNQVRFIDLLRKEGMRVEVHWSPTAVIKTIKEYLGYV